MSAPNKPSAKRFNTRARSRTGVKIAGKGYDHSDIDHKLPKLPDGATFGAEEQATYQQFKKKRAGKGLKQYSRLEGEFARYLEDPYTDPPVPRDSLTDEVEILIIGAGFGALLALARLRASGFTDIRICEKGGDVGGTWYWNRYPGIACDVESYSYFPLLEEMKYYPTMRFSSGFEIFEYCQKVAEKYNAYECALFHTTVIQTDWNEELGRWIVKTDRGDAMKARFVVMANGVLTQPKIAKINGMHSYKGISFHTSRWDYSHDLRGKRVGIIGTGATAIQAIPELAKVVGHLYVFQRTPSSIDIRNQRKTTLEQIEKWKRTPNWAVGRRARHASITSGRAAILADDEDFLEGKIKRKKKKYKKLTNDEINAKLLEANFRIMERVRQRVGEIVKDPKTAEALKPWYPYGCKRPTFHDTYLQTFNLPHITLVDTQAKGVQLINEKGPVVDGKTYDVDVLIYATGFEWMAASTFNMVRGRSGVTLTDKWKNGTKTFLGLHSNGFPNLFIVSGPQGGGGSFNFTTILEEHAKYIEWMLSYMRKTGAHIVDVNKEAEEEYARHCADADTKSAPLRDCISYYNAEGTAKPGDLAYYGGTAWDERLKIAKESMEPFLFDQPPLLVSKM